MGKLAFGAGAALLIASWPAAFAAENAAFDSSGRLTNLYGATDLAIRSRMTPGPVRSDGVVVTRDGGEVVWRGEIENGAFRQTASDSGSGTHIVLEVTAKEDLKIDGAWYRLEVARALFAGGEGKSDTGRAVLTVERPAGRGFLNGESRSLSLRAPSGMQISATFDRALPVRLEDRWDRNGRTYVAAIEFHHGPLAAGSTARLDLTLSLSGTPDDAPAHLKLDTAQKRYNLRGFGGNYCFAIESPITQYTLRNLQVAWARTEMSLVRWVPEGAAGDTPDSRLRHEFELMRQLNQMHIPYVSSVWQLPEEFYTDPGPKPHRQAKRRIADDKWPALLDAIASYLTYAKEHYRAEPDLFSFNESNIGIDVLLSPEEHRDAIKRIGAHLEKLGLKTKLLLADVSGPRDTHEYALPAANDPDAMRYVGAVGVHSWGGASPEQYKAWGDLAEWLNLPLLVSELGVDAGAHRGKVYDSFQYGLREVELYQQLLLYARPQGTMQWEFTSDYGAVRDNLQPTPRFWFVKHFTDLTPRNADALGTASDQPKVLFTAFAGGGDYTLHIANLGAAREVTIDGVPDGVPALREVVTSAADSYRQFDAVAVQTGSLRLRIPARSLVTLTTMAPARTVSVTRSAAQP
jgi:hypothetical protein